MAAQNTQFITLRSTDRVSGTSGSAVFRIPSLDLPKRHTVFLVSANVPYTFYNTDAPDNVFYFRETGPVTTTASFTIPPGNYSSAELAALLETSMTTNSPNTLSYLVDYDYNTGKMTFNTQNPAVTVEFEENEMSLKLFLAIGFYTEASGGGYNKDGTTVGQTITSPSYCQAGPSHLTLESNLRYRGHHTLYKGLNMMATFPMSGGPGDNMLYEPSDRVELFTENDLGLLQNIRVTWRRDDTGREISSFHGVPWTITIGVRGVTPT